MPMFLVRRDVPGATQDDIDAAFLRAVSCAYTYEGLHWVTSYWDQAGGAIHCIWEAEGPEQLFDHARRSRVPCDEVREVRQIMPEDVLEQVPEVVRA